MKLFRFFVLVARRKSDFQSIIYNRIEKEENIHKYYQYWCKEIDLLHGLIGKVRMEFMIDYVWPISKGRGREEKRAKSIEKWKKTF